jgi:hypothetical protein
VVLLNRLAAHKESSNLVLKHNFRSLKLPILEQLSASAGSFFFFMLTARTLGLSDFGLFALHLVPAQIAHGIAAQWLLLPITTTPGNRLSRRLLKSLLLRLGILAVAIPILATVYGLVTGTASPLITFVCLVSLIGLTLILFDLVRYVAIRYEYVKRQFAANIIRWCTSLSVLICGYFWITKGPLIGVFAFVIGLGAGMAVCGSVVLRELEVDMNSPEDLETVTVAKDGNALLSLGVANASFSLVSTVALARSSIAGFGAFLAFRSLVNWAPLLLQYMETHFASRLAKSGRIRFTNVTWIMGFTLAMLMGESAILLAGDWFLRITVGTQYTEFAWLLAVMFAIVIVQTYTRAVGIEVRLNGAKKVIWTQVLLIGGASSSFVLGLLFPAVGLSFEATIAIIAGVASMQALAMTLGLKSHYVGSTHE